VNLGSERVHYKLVSEQLVHYTILAPLPGNTESTFLNDISLVSLAYLATPLAFPPISLVVSRKLSGDSTNDKVNNDFTMGPRKL
jgi:hypothetical protein